MTASDANAVAAKPRIGILAGSGRLPSLIADAIVSKGQLPFVINLTSEFPKWLHNVEHVTVPLTRLSTIIKTLRGARISQLILAGGIDERPSISNFLLDWRMYGEFFLIFRALRRGDDGLLRAAIGLLERKGFVVIGAHEIAPSLLASETVLTKRRPTTTDLVDIAAGIDAAIALGHLDRGQAAVARSGQIIAKEARSGTAAMLTGLAASAPQTPNGVLVKWSKPNQELRVDLPAIGPDTIKQARGAGLAGIVVEAGRALILDRQEVVRLADAHHLFVVGLSGKP